MTNMLVPGRRHESLPLACRLKENKAQQERYNSDGKDIFDLSTKTKYSKEKLLHDPTKTFTQRVKIAALCS